MVRGVKRRVTYYQFEQYQIWGATGRVVELFLSPRDAASLTAISPPMTYGGQVLDFELR